MQRVDPNNANPIIQMHDVGFTYLGSAHPVLRNISFKVYPGEFVLVLGRSGSGKSTFSMLMNGLIPHSIPGNLTGTVEVDGLTTSASPVHELATRVGMVFQDPDAQIVNVLVQDEIHFGMENLLWNEEIIKAKGRESMRRLGIESLRFRNVMSLSGGQKQKVILSSVIGVAPKLLVLDEPTANLDPLGTREVFEIIGQLNREHNITVIMVENRVDELVEWITRVVLLEDGTITLDGPPRDVYRNLHGRDGLWLPQVTEMAMKYSPDDKHFLPVTVDEGVEFLLNRFAPQSRTSHREETPDPSPGSTPILDVKQLNFRYHPKMPLVLQDVSLQIPSGGIVAIVGQNGSGKTTLARLLVRIHNPPAGTVFLQGADIRQLSLSEVSKRIGYAFQNPDHQFVANTVYDELAYSLRAHQLPEDVVDQKTREMIQRMSLDNKEQASPFSLSVGERRRLSVGTMLILDQPLLILDEPTIGQDPSRARALMQLLADQAYIHGHTLLLITHDMRLVADWTKRTVVLNRGEILYDGDTPGVFRDPALLRQAHLVEPPIAQIARQVRQSLSSFPNHIVSLHELATVWPPMPAAKDRRATYGT